MIWARFSGGLAAATMPALTPPPCAVLLWRRPLPSTPWTHFCGPHPFLLGFPHLSRLSQNWRGPGPGSGWGFGLREWMLWLVWSIPTTKTFSLSVVRLFYSVYHSCIHWSSTWFPSKPFPFFAFTTWLIICGKRPSGRPLSAFDMPSLWSIIISSFWFTEMCDSSFPWNM